jgi:hypothetical protein
MDVLRMWSLSVLEAVWKIYPSALRIFCQGLDLVPLPYAWVDVHDDASKACVQEALKFLNFRFGFYFVGRLTWIECRKSYGAIC